MLCRVEISYIFESLNLGYIGEKKTNPKQTNKPGVVGCEVSSRCSQIVMVFSWVYRRSNKLILTELDFVWYTNFRLHTVPDVPKINSHPAK